MPVRGRHARLQMDFVQGGNMFGDDAARRETLCRAQLQAQETPDSFGTPRTHL